MCQLIDIISAFYHAYGKSDALASTLNKLNTLVTECKKEGDDAWKGFISFIGVQIKGAFNVKAFYSKLFPSLRKFLKSSNPHFSGAMLDSTAGRETSQGGDKKYRFQAKKGFFTFICKDFQLTKEDMLEAFKQNPKFGYKIEKAISCNEIAPETGEKHVHIWVQFYDKIDTKDARKYFSVEGIYLNIKPDGNTSRSVSYCLKGVDYIIYNLDPHSELNTRKMHMQLLGYELINKKITMTKAVETYPELLFKYDSTKSNLNSYYHGKDMECNPGNPLLEWNMFGIQTWFSGSGKTPRYWMVGPSNVGKTYNIDTLEGSGHRAYLMSKENEWSNYSDNDYDFIYNEETGAVYKITFLNQLLEGTRTKLSGRYVKSITKRKNMPIILNSNYMPHMLYKNTSLYDLAPTLNRMYIIYVDKLRRGHVIWNPEIMSIEDYGHLFMNNEMPMENYEARFYSEFMNESHSAKSYIKYQSTFEKEERAERERTRKEQDEIMREGERLVEEAMKKKRKEREEGKEKEKEKEIHDQNISSSRYTISEVDSDEDIVESEELNSKRNLDSVLTSNKADMNPWMEVFNSMVCDDESSIIENDESNATVNDDIVSGYIDYNKLEPPIQPSDYMDLHRKNNEHQSKTCNKNNTTVPEKPVVDVRNSDRFKKRVDTTTSQHLGRKLFDEWMKNRKNNNSTHSYSDNQDDI